MPSTEREETPNEPMDEDERLSKFKLDISRDANATQEQREAANEDMRFVNVKGGMWEGFLTNDFDEDRVRMEFDLVSNFLYRYLGNFELNPVGVEFKPDDGATSDDDAELLNGIYRADFLNFSGAIATDNGVEEAATCGVGAMKLATIFEDEEDPENELQRIEWRPIYNAYNTVMWDEAAQRIDKRDARWCTVLKAFTSDSFKAEYPDADAVSAYTPESHTFNQDRSTPSLIYVAERYEVIKRKESVWVYDNLESGVVETYSAEDHKLIEDELKTSIAHSFVRKRIILRRIVEKSVFNGNEFLQQPKRIVGKWLPVVPFYAYRSYVDGSEWYRGLIRKLKDPQRTFNVEMSQIAENAASAGQEVPIFLRAQMENPAIKELWANKNNKPYLVVDPVTDAAGNIINAGPIGYSKPAALDQSTATLLQKVPEFMRETTGGAPQETMNPDVSGKAIKALIERENLTTAKPTKNIKDAVLWSGEIYQAMAAEVYSTQRMLRTVGKDGTASKTQLFKTVMDEETGKLVESNTIIGKKFRAFADIGPRYDTVQEETVETAKGMIETLAQTPGGEQYIPALIGVAIENSTGSGMDPVKKLARQLQIKQGLIKPETDEDKQMLQQFQQEQAEGDPQQELLKAAAGQQEAETRNLDAASGLKVADTRKTEAETIKIFDGLDESAERLAMDRRAQTLKTLQSLPLQQ